MRFKKLTAAITSVVMLCSAAALPAANIGTAFATTNLISNSTFDSGTSGWGMYKESGGVGSLSTSNGRLALKVENVGKLNYSLQMFYDIIPLYKNGVYHLSYEVSSDVERYVEGMIQLNGGDYHAYTWKGIDVSSNPTVVDYQFTMEDDTDIMAKMVFNCGNEEKDAGKNLGSHTIYLDNVVLELVDDSKVDYSEIRAYEPPIVVNQVGYKPNDTKKAVVRVDNGSTQDVPDKFSVVSCDTDPYSVVYTGSLSNGINNSGAGETDWIADFSEVKTPGKYFIKCDGFDDSYTFEISENPYKNLLDDSIRMLYLQRCGTAIEDKTFNHVACHNTKARVYGTNNFIDVSGGWHDAGDYGRYVVPAAKTIADLLNAYDTNPDMFSDSIGIPESGNSVPDVLDEVRYALDWMFKMQEADGGVHHKVTCESFPGYVMPEKETDELIVTPVSSTATADFCGAMAIAYSCFKSVDSDYALKCLEAAEKAWAYLEANPNFNFKNPEDITTGDYGDKSDTDERYWAVAELYRATKNEKYLNALSVMATKTGLDWALVGDYGNIAILKTEGMDKISDTLYTKAKNAVVNQAKTFAKNTNASPYGVALTRFNWGSNMTVANAGIILGLAAELEDNDSYFENAKSNLFYLFGENPNGVCFVTGYGTVSPENPHHRPSMAKGTAMKGMLVGGVNSALEDSAAKAYLNGVAQHKCYVDHSESYSTNEVTTYWNSPMIYLMALLSSDGETNLPATNIKGDVNADKNVDVLDVALLQKYIVNDAKINQGQFDNADMDGDTDVDVIDVMKLRNNIISKSSNPVPPVTTATSADQGTTTTTTTTVQTIPQPQGPDMSADMIADFRQGASQYFIASDGWSNEQCFNCTWYKENTSFANGALNLTIDRATKGNKPYSAAEYRTNDFYGYGYYETSMQAIKNDGVVSSFFTYTGETDGNPWDEIDIEVLGKDTTMVQFNYYTNGVGNHEYFYDLGFDASQGFHTYGFDWQADHITWYIDGVPVYTATDNIPSTPGKIMMNVWPGINVDGWLKPFDGTTPLTAKYEWVTFKK